MRKLLACLSLWLVLVMLPMLTLAAAPALPAEAACCAQHDAVSRAAAPGVQHVHAADHCQSAADCCQAHCPALPSPTPAWRAAASGERLPHPAARFTSFIPALQAPPPRS
nr:hypothetical protein [Chromobacterium sp. ASV5]